MNIGIKLGRKLVLIFVTWESGIVPKVLALLPIWPVFHSGLLTTALHFMHMLISNHNVLGKKFNSLKIIIVLWSVQRICMVNWFNIRIHSKWSESPNHQLYLLKLLKQQSPCVKDLVLQQIT